MNTLPQAFVDRMTQQLGDELPAFLRCYEAPYLRALRFNPRKPLPPEALETLQGLGTPVPWEPAARYLSVESDAGAVPLHEAGAYYLQEPSAMVPVAALDPRPGERILDLCAAPGGKSTQIAGRMLGEGLLVWYACRKRDEGMPLEELYAWAEDAKLHLCHWFTVDDLMYLKRGGRISAATAVVGTMLQIKPVLHMDDEGHLISMAKARGRKASIDALVRKVGELGQDYDNSTMFISHGDCLEDAEYLASQLREKCGAKEVIISYVGAVIGSHSGPGTVALFFLGKHR